MNQRTPAQQAHRRRTLINWIGLALLLLAGVLTVLLFYMHSPPLQAWYREFQLYVEDLENLVLSLPGVWLTLLAVLALYAVKSVFWPLPIPMMCFITGATQLPMYLSVAVNVAGLMLLFTIRFFWGRRRGGGRVKKLLSRQRDIRDYLEHGRGGKSWLLFFFRLMPYFPLNTVSQIYGGMDFDYADYILLSLLGFLPKLLSYTVMGHNVFKPLSVPFIVPMIILFTLSGVSTIGINTALNKRKEPAP